MELPEQKSEQLEELLALCRHKLKPMCQILLPNRFTAPFSRQHDAFFEVYDDPSVKQMVVVCHRDWGKTSIFNYAVPAQHILFKKSEFIVPVSASALGASLQSENLKRTLRSNNDFKAIVGRLDDSDTFAKELWITGNGVMVLPRGAGQQVRGILHEDTRPNLVLVDDLEKSEEAKSEDQRKKLKEYFFSDLYGTLDHGRDDWRMIVVGTILHQDSLLISLMDDPDWVTINQPLASKTLVSFWQERFTDAAVEKLYNQYARQGMKSAFYREYLNEAAAPEDFSFKKEHFRYFDEHDMRWDDSEFEHFVIKDPARSTKATSCPTAIIGGSVNTRLGRIYFRELVNDRLEPDEAVTQTFNMAERLNAPVIGYEVDGLELYEEQLMKSEMLRRGLSFELVPLRAKASAKGDFAFKGMEKGKDSRISQLIPWYRLGQVYHNSAGTMADLEEQLLSFPHGKWVDAADVASYVIQLMSLGERLFEDQSTPIGQAMSEHEEEMLDEMYFEDARSEFKESRHDAGIFDPLDELEDLGSFDEMDAFDEVGAW